MLPPRLGDVSREPALRHSGRVRWTTAELLARAAASSGDPQTTHVIHPMGDVGEQVVADLLLEQQHPSWPDADLRKGQAVRFERESRDDDWSGRMENALTAALARRAASLYKLQVARPDCTATLCMLTAVGNVSDGIGPGSLWALAIADMRTDPWWGANFDSLSATTTPRGDHVVYQTYMERRR